MEAGKKSGAEGERKLEKGSETRADETDRTEDIKRNGVNRTKKESAGERELERERWVEQRERGC